MSESLIKVRELLSDPNNWTQGSNARTSKDGNPVLVNHPEATCFCLTGALFKFDCPVEDFSLLRQEARRIDKSCMLLVEFNDRHPHEDVLKLLDTVIARGNYNDG